MSSIILTEWSISMCESLLNWDDSSSKQVDRLSQLQNIKSLQRQPQSSIPPSRLDLALHATRCLAEKSLRYPSIVNGSLQSESITYATFGSAGLQNVSSRYEDFRDGIALATASQPFTKASYVSLFSSLQMLLKTVKTSAYVVVFCSTTGSASAISEFRSLTSEQRLALLPLPNADLQIVPIGKGSVEDFEALDFFQELITLNDGEGRSSSKLNWSPNFVKRKSLQKSYFDLINFDLAIDAMAKLLYRPFSATLFLGELSGRVQLVPSPMSLRGGFQSFSEDFRILGTLEKAVVDKLSHPLRTYYVLPSDNHPNGASNVNPAEEPHLAPYLHASLRVLATHPNQPLVLLVCIGKAWYGYIEPTEDLKTRKKSGLVLQAFPTGATITDRPVLDEDLDATSVHGSDIPSYSTGSSFIPVYTSVEAVTSDIGRVSRISRKLPERKEAFFTELNKLRLHAFATCNFAFFEQLIRALEKERVLLKDGTAMAEVDNVMQQLRADGEKLNTMGALVSISGVQYPIVSQSH
ncbi:hypothetical protein RvY_00869 [Ramazzottius varieornatus]|uniref:Integrator complex subunit 14 C-terminal domain-containing protein n=1 Tax=Ramazzottius varieornatus TaxID=947166 RepID=A0A1D1UEA1_RAMVA|nr:hypothetical protein RvY_00869 [Ramazzottius varieornatus]